MNRSRSQLVAACTVALAALVIAGCGSGGSHSKPKPKQVASTDASSSGSTLILHGAPVDSKTGQRLAEPAARARAAAPAAPTKTVKPGVVVGVRVLDPPALNADGTIAGTDPFGSDVVTVQPTPIEDDVNANASVASFAMHLKDYDVVDWDAWVHSGASLPGTTGDDTVTPSLVTIAVERCGGARSVAAGVVLGPETVVTTVTAVDNADQRVWVSPTRGAGSGTGVTRIPAMIRYLDVDDDIAVLKVPGLRMPALATHVPTGSKPMRAYAYGLSAGGRTGRPQRVPVFAAMVESSLTKEQPDGFDRAITDRAVYPLIGAIDTGYTGGVVAATNDSTLATGWGFHGLIRARIPYRAEGGGVAVPSRLVGIAIAAAAKLDPWSEVMPAHCPEWTR